ncbi:flagellar assembly protein FliW [Dorea sp. D27]|uniref:flagellar assembly protein FliW n=1 Tax=Dorea sp. D27 TaxID=658665 RepID=UPI0006735639|nr:flagellar assembly protein FliW [Dorea sp. D27]KMZ54345.1 flagellar assembly factor FliW [Dorea sp. D27]
MMEERGSSFPFEKEELISFEEGLFGFENYKHFLPLPITEDSDAVLNLLSVEDESLSFIIMNPFLLMNDYAPRLPDDIYHKLEAEDEADLSFYVICVVGDSPEDSTVNFKCPIVVNTVSRKAVQVILESDTYCFRHTLKDIGKEEV